MAESAGGAVDARPERQAADLWYTRCPVPTASSIAIETGMLEREFAPDGMRVASLRASASRDVWNSHFEHDRANLFRQGGNIPPIWSRARGRDVVLVAVSWVDEYQAIVALPGSGIERPADLRGRRLALPRRVNDSIDYWRAMCLRGYAAALDAAGLALADAAMVDLPVEEKQIGDAPASRRGSLWKGGARARRQQREAFALIRGEVDAIYVAGAPGAQLTAFLGAYVVFDLGNDAPGRINNQVPTLLTVSGETARTRPDIVARYLKVLLHAAQWAREHPDETYRIVANDVGAPEDWVHAAYGEKLHYALDLGLQAQALDAVQSQIDFLHRHDFIETPYDVRDWIDPRPWRLATA